MSLRTQRYAILGTVTMAGLTATFLVILGLFSPGVVLAQGDEPTPIQGELQSTPLPDGVEPFVMTFPVYRDSWIDQADPHANHGTDLELTLRADSGAAAFALLSCDLSALPGDAQVISATLSTYSTDTASDPYPILPYAITTAWSETSVTWDTRPGTAHLGDLPARHVPEGWTVFEVTDIVRAWRDGSQANYGIALRPDTGASGTRTYQARKAAMPPELTIYYTRQAVLETNQDTWIDASHPSDSHGTDAWLRTASPSSTYGERLLLVGFDFASLPEDIAVMSATLEMFTYFTLAGEASPTQATYQYAEAIISDWDESLTWNDTHESLYLDDPPSVYDNMWNEWDVTNIVQRWTLDLAPKGILVRAAAESPLLHSFYSRETGSNPPKLTVAYGAAPPTCNPVTSVQVNGVSSGVTGIQYTFQAVTTPTDADPPDGISWDVTDHGRLYGQEITVGWDTAGTKTLTVLVSHCGGHTSTQHEVLISEPPPDCAVPLRGVFVSGPLVVSARSPYTYTATALPSSATKPITFTWQATDQVTFVESTMGSTSEQVYTWGVAGSKTIAVTAQNCSGSATVYEGVEVVPPADLPDLTISTAWLEEDLEQIGYVVHNEGNTTVPAGFYVSFEFQGFSVAVSQHTSSLPPGGVAVGFLDYAWGCSRDFERVGVLADWDDLIVEVDEINNLWQANWTCDQQPPEIVGPEIVRLGETTADIRWTANEACDGWLEWGTSPDEPNPAEVPGNTGATEHNAQLSGLTPGDTYFVRAFCTDAAGLTSNTEALLFEALPLGAGPPRLRSLTLQRYPSTMYDFWELVLEMEDDLYMDRVEFAMDGYLVGLDYSGESSGGYLFYRAYLSPAAMGLSRAEFFRQHTFQATAFRQHPDGIGDLIEDLTPVETDPEVTADILEPHNLHKIYIEDPTVPAGTVLDVSVRAAAFDWHCSWGAYTEGVVPPGEEGVDCDDLTQQEAETVTLWIDGIQLGPLTPAPGEMFLDFPVAIGGLAVGSHQIEVLAQASGVSATDQKTFIVEQGEPSLEVSRSVRREGNTLEVTLDLHNAGTLDARVVRIYDNIVGLQQANVVHPSGDYRISSFGWDWVAPDSSLMQNNVLIRFLTPGLDGMTYVTIPPGGDYRVSYVVVPILFEDNVTRSIGEQAPVSVELVEEGRITRSETFDLPCMVVDDPEHGLVAFPSAVIYAVRQADYLLVTNPRRAHEILWDHGLADVPQIFASMAELASLKNGVLGFLFTYDDDDVLDDLLEPGNYWAESLNPIFKEVDQGYVLIVGEIEIVQSWYAGTSNFATYPGIPDYVHDSDIKYANTAGETMRPELVLGRVIGNSAEKLDKYLENVIAAARGEPGTGFHRSWAYVSNGNGDGEWTFQQDAEWVDDQLDDRYDDSTWKNFIGESGEEQIAIHQLYMPNRDLILYRGHGNTDVWDDGFGTGWAYLIQGSTNPAMLAAACTTGNYEKGDDYNLAEALLWKGAGAYVGATEKSERGANSNGFLNIVPMWDREESMGQALNQVKRKIWSYDCWFFDHNKLWAYEYNLYGDPKYGRMEAQALEEDALQDENLSVAADALGLSLRVSLPELIFSRVGRNDEVRIPGGGVLAEPGAYPVPVWTLSMELHPGQKVQDVELVDQGSPVVISSLNLPVVEPAIDLESGIDALASPTAKAVADWHPQMNQVLDWSAEEGPGGKTMLYITLYPFYYHAATGDALYYRSYQLAVQTLDSAVHVESFEAGPGPYEPRDPVDLHLIVSNQLRPRDVIVQASVRTMGTNKVLGGLPLKTLHSLEGTATVELVWDTRPYGAGEYQIVVKLLDTAGRLLDTGVAEVELGTVGARLTDLAASQETFVPGDAIGLRMGVRNTGSVPLDGVGMFWIQSPTELSATAVITAPFAALAPGSTVYLRGEWDTGGVEGYEYRVLAYAKFRSQATEPLALPLYRPRLFLPLVVRNQ